MTTGSDTNILLDILFDSPEFGEASMRALHTALATIPGYPNASQFQAR
jgi:hypothetical protein